MTESPATAAAATGIVALLAWIVMGFGLATVADATDPRLPSPAGWPLAGHPAVVAGFDPPASTYGAGHRGIDLAGRPGEPVLAVAAGTVVFAGSVAGIGVVVVDHGAVRTTYQPVRAGVIVGHHVGLGTVLGSLERGGHCPPAACLHLGLVLGERYLDPLLLMATEPSELRLLPAAERGAALHRTAERARVSRAAAIPGPDPVLAALGSRVGVAGRHGFLLPVVGPLSSPFGERFHPVLHVWKLHDGTDVAAACGAAIRAPAAGMVIAAYANPGYGNRLILDHGTVDGHHLVTAMNHATGYLVGVGARVRRGQVVGSVGATGLATGCHLHLMVWIDDRLVDPMTWFG
ncbi:MAG: M23 family metallopeptidase [Propionibacteriaceae bacterium]